MTFDAYDRFLGYTLLVALVLFAISGPVLVVYFALMPSVCGN